ncbi:WbqC family protein [Andreprevotia chitinilytica]|uniref:WbqC family protein n=1 Tax=Andreprevotia chitinilytica TaxID=396808 RepID=UPI00054D7836|nr:WbqC family protein [Andreprevotia chitinilytica]
MILTAHQPVYLPWLGLFHKIALAERFCVFDIAQYQTKDFNNRNKIKTNAGPLWLSVPVESKDHFEKKLSDIKIINNGWNRKHFKSIDMAYRKAPFYQDYIHQLEALLLGKTYERLAELNFATLDFGLKALGISVPIDIASEHDFQGYKSDLVLDMCKQLGATTYIFGAQGRNYADVDGFLQAGITPHFQDYQHPVYPQLHGEFEPYMSIIDLLFNVGPDSFNVLMRGNVTQAADAAR